MRITRHLNRKVFKSVNDDLHFLVDAVIGSSGEYDLQLRDGYVNLYFKGNSLALIRPSSDKYTVEINNKFIRDENGKGVINSSFDSRFRRGKDYSRITLLPKELQGFFSSRDLRSLARRVSEVNYGEEIVFEQMLFTDNIDNDDWILIDRQVTDPGLRRRRIDVLALRRLKGSENEFSFVVLEVKLGKNRDLAGPAFAQLAAYVSHVQQHFQEYKKTYEENYMQKLSLGLLSTNRPQSINIVGTVEGAIVVGWYSGLAEISLAQASSLPYKVFRMYCGLP